MDFVNIIDIQTRLDCSINRIPHFRPDLISFIVEDAMVTLIECLISKKEEFVILQYSVGAREEE